MWREYNNALGLIRPYLDSAAFGYGGNPAAGGAVKVEGVGSGVKAVANAVGDAVSSVGKAIASVFSGW